MFILQAPHQYLEKAKQLNSPLGLELRFGVDDYLTKPFDEEELLVRIENLLKNQAARRTVFTDETAPKAAPLMSQPDRERLGTFEIYVQQHFASDILSVTSLANEFAMSESTLLRQLKRLTGLSPVQYLLEVRLEEGRRLNENRVFSSITQVAARVGYADHWSFARSFRLRFGKLPSELLAACLAGFLLLAFTGNSGSAFAQLVFEGFLPLFAAMKNCARLAVRSMLLVIALAGSNTEKLSAQTCPPAAEDSKIWPLIEARLAEPGGDTARHFILEKIREQCGSDYGCRLQSLSQVASNGERLFNLPLAIFVCEEIVRTARQSGDLSAEATAFRDLSRLHQAIGNRQIAFSFIQKELQLLEKLGDHSRILRVKMLILERKIDYSPFEEVMPKMEALLEQAYLEKDTFQAIYFHVRMMSIAQVAKQFVHMERHVAALENAIESGSARRANSEKNHSIYAAMGRAVLFMSKNQLAEAEPFFKLALQRAQTAPDDWLEVQMLRYLTDLAARRGDNSAAKKYLEQSQDRAEKAGLDDHLAVIFTQKASIAERENRFADALEAVKKQHFHHKKFKSRGAGFIEEAFFLQQEKEKQGLDLRLRKTQLIGAMGAALLALLSVVLLFFSLKRQRKARRELAEQNALIQKQAEQLRSLDEAKSRFFANVSHELRTPLTLLTSPIQTLLKEKQLTEKQTQLLQMAERSGKQLGQLINEILDLRKLEMGKMTVMLEPTELRAYFQTYFAQFESLAAQKQIDYQVVVDMPDNAIADLDREKCRQILFNLLSNAFKFTPQGGRIEAKVQALEQTLELQITNSGTGIHPDDLPHIFDRYFQPNRPDKPVEGGTGIGLALCREYAQLFGGSIHAASTLGAYTVFRVIFPLHFSETKGQDAAPQVSSMIAERYDEAAALPHPVATISQPTDKQPTILLVEDNPDLRDYIRMVLQDRYHVITAEHGQAALEVMSDKLLVMGSPGTPNPSHISHNSSLITPDLILSDLMMPVMDGYQLLERLKSDDATRHIPFIMLTARTEMQDKLTALRIGVDDYLTKPFDEEELLVRIENLLKNQAARRAATALDDNTAASEAAAVPLMSQPDREWLESFEEYVQKHFSSDILSVSSLAHEFTMSESTLLRQLKRLTGLSPLQYIQEVRLNEARRLLENRAYNSIAQVAWKVGYSQVDSFTRSFKQRFGKLPSEMMEA